MRTNLAPYSCLPCILKLLWIKDHGLNRFMILAGTCMPISCFLNSPLKSMVFGGGEMKLLWGEIFGFKLFPNFSIVLEISDNGEDSWFSFSRGIRGRYFSKRVQLCPEAEKPCPSKIFRIMALPPIFSEKMINIFSLC